MHSFEELTPDHAITCAENVIGTRLSGLCRPYKSYINRVYELQDMKSNPYIIKFYRPGRWTRECILEEHAFLLELQEAEVPVIAPLIFNRESLHYFNNIPFALFPKKGGRNFDEFQDEQWLEIGRLLGRVHAIGALKDTQHRPVFTPQTNTQIHLDYLLNGHFIPLELEKKYSQLVHQFIEIASPLFENTPLQRVHGDLHFANLIYRPGECFYIIDLDDMVMGPAAQDIWMLLPGLATDCRRELNLLLEGYETFKEFDDRTLVLVESLRLMRYIHFTAWCAYQKQDINTNQLSPDWGSYNFWQNEIRDTENQLQEIQNSKR